MPASNQLQEAAQAMAAAAAEGRSVLRVLKARCPHIHQQIANDAKNRDLLALWGRSCNLDENAGQTIVAPAILEAIGAQAGIPMRGRFVHAGHEHTYGYLFSLIDTPYGPKRNRWVTTDLENGFDLDPTLLGDRPNAGTLLGNLTWFLARIVFRLTPGFQFDERNARTVAPEILRFDYARLSVSRIVERIVLTGKARRQVLIFTDLVPFPNAAADPTKENTLLIYSIQTGARSLAKLITAFPVSSRVVTDLKESALSPRKVRVRLRYNAYLAGLFGRDVPGHRTLVEHPAQS